MHTQVGAYMRVGAYTQQAAYLSAWVRIRGWVRICLYIVRAVGGVTYTTAAGAYTHQGAVRIHRCEVEAFAQVLGVRIRSGRVYTPGCVFAGRGAFKCVYTTYKSAG